MRHRSTRALLAVGAAVAAVMATVGAPASAASPTGEWPQFLGGPAHQGWNKVETTLGTGTAPALVSGWTASLKPSGYFPSAGPASVAGGVAYVGGGDVRAVAVDSGRLLWQRSLGTLDGGFYSRGAVITAPAVANGLVVVGTDPVIAAPGQVPRALVAGLDARTGAIRWHHVFPYRVGIPASPTIYGTHVYVSTTGVSRLQRSGTVFGLDLTTGAVQWRHPVAAAMPLSSPTTDGRLVYVSDGQTVRALSAVTGATVWARQLSTQAVETQTAFTIGMFGGTVYAGTMAGTVSALDATTGRVRWTTMVGGWVSGSVEVDPTTVYAQAFQGGTTLFALDRHTGRIRWDRHLSGTGGELAVANGVVYVGVYPYYADTHTALQLLREPDGSPLGLVLLPYGDPVNNQGAEPDPVVSGGRVLVTVNRTLGELQLPATART